jgi:hypothetical protein
MRTDCGVRWKKLLTYITGSVDQELLLRNEYLIAENRLLRNQLQGRLQFKDSERKAWLKSALAWTARP